MVRVSITQMFYQLLVEACKTFLYWPVWWYSRGLVKVLQGGWQFIKDYNLTLGFTIWLKNLFVPMFGQNGLVGRLISFVLRIIQIIFRGLALLIICILVIVFIIMWLVLPVFVLLKILTYWL